MAAPLCVALWLALEYRPVAELGDSDYLVRRYLLHFINGGHQVEVTKNKKAQDYTEPSEDEG